MVLGKEASTGGIIATFVPLKFPGGTKMFTIIFTRPPFLSERVWVLDLAHTGHYYTYILLVPMLTSNGWGGRYPLHLVHNGHYLASYPGHPLKMIWVRDWPLLYLLVPKLTSAG